MITYSKLGKKGNLGNQLFQIASTIGVAIENKQDYVFPDWKYQHYFKNKLPLLENDLSHFITIEETEYNYYHRDLGTENYDLSGWLQTEKYFDKSLAKYYFEFSASLIGTLKNSYQKAFVKRTILISIRRGDFVNHPDYLQLPINFYLNSLVQFLPDWESCNLIVLSDDIKYCKFHFSFLENVFFGEGLHEVEQLCLGSLCDDFIISNSTFSWWSAWLGEKEGSKVIRPFKNFDGLKSLELNDKDYYPDRWIKYNHLDVKLKLDNLGFYIRSKKNKEIIKNYVLHYFDVAVTFEENEFDSSKDSYILKGDYFLPPFLIYYSWLQINKPGVKLVTNTIDKTFKVSRKLNYDELFVQKDFGLFSAIFSFPKKKVERRKNTSAIFLKKGNDLREEFSNDFSSDEIWINFSGGKLLEFGGYSYSFKKYIKRKKIQLKKRIKKFLLKK
ncbi:alpha-1,2-fucosyltransferase [Flavobacterium sp. FlaQc-48]|uniref:alpha-1,2-fucosyltransferase n=1 Tax=Flavobacterium sp. FlaQc-48 TaxID=3374181 RepID=UPI0037582FCA